MLIEPQAAQTFCEHYTAIMAEIHVLFKGENGIGVHMMIAKSRKIAVSNPAILDTALQNLESTDYPIHPDVIRAVKSLQLNNWVYLRDTRAYSVFINPEATAAYAVLGLTDRIRKITGDTGICIRTGIVEYCGSFMCDGVVSNPVWIGPNYRREFTTILSQLKKEGKFYTKPEAHIN